MLCWRCWFEIVLSMVLKICFQDIVVVVVLGIQLMADRPLCSDLLFWLKFVVTLQVVFLYVQARVCINQGTSIVYWTNKVVKQIYIACLCHLWFVMVWTEYEGYNKFNNAYNYRCYCLLHQLSKNTKPSQKLIGSCWENVKRSRHAGGG